MALCEHCRAELDGAGEQLPPPWFDRDDRTIAGQRVTPMVWAVLEVLYRRRGRVVSTDTLMTLLYSDRPDDPPSDKIIDVYICHLRAALTPTPYAIRTDWGEGYQLVDYKSSTEPVISGDIEDGVPPPPPRERPTRRDKYGFADLLQPGQSRRIQNAKLTNLNHACRAENKRGPGRFTAGLDEDGYMRIWRVE